MNCSGCFRDFDNELEITFHYQICIFYIYKNKYPTSNIYKETITNIILISNLFNLYNLIDSKSIIYKKDILYNLNNKIIINNSLQQQNKINIIQYIYKLINDDIKTNYNYLDLIKFISLIINIDFTIIHQVIKCYNISKINFKNIQ